MKILTPLRTRTLLGIASTSQHFSSLVLCLLRSRAASLTPRDLLLEIIDPASPYRAPVLCRVHQATSSLCAAHTDVGFSQEASGEGEGYGQLNGHYSRFRPIGEVSVAGPERLLFRAAESPSQFDALAGSQSMNAQSLHSQYERVEHQVHLDSHELFSQFHAAVNVVKCVPKPGIYVITANVARKVVRVWRDWLDAQAHIQAQNVSCGRIQLEEEQRGETKRDNLGADDRSDRENNADSERPATGEPDASVPFCRSLLWTDHTHNVGLIVSIRNRNNHHRSTFETEPGARVGQDELPASYSLKVQGKLPLTSALGNSPPFQSEQITCLTQFPLFIRTPCPHQTPHPSHRGLRRTLDLNFSISPPYIPTKHEPQCCTTTFSNRILTSFS